jgi:hypothetical protein
LLTDYIFAHEGEIIDKIHVHIFPLIVQTEAILESSLAYFSNLRKTEKIGAGARRGSELDPLCPSR